MGANWQFGDDPLVISRDIAEKGEDGWGQKLASPVGRFVSGGHTAEMSALVSSLSSAADWTERRLAVILNTCFLLGYL